MAITADLTQNKKQEAFVGMVLAAAFGDNAFRYFFFGGAIRGGKTYACLCTLIILCRLFPGSKWYVIRKSFSRIQETTLPTMEKILKGSVVRWNRDKANFYVEFPKTGSKIFFAGEDYNQDKELGWLLGLECNGIFMEQIEELQEKTLQIAITRLGSEIIPNMPTPLLLSTFNPTLTWVRHKIYDPWADGKLEAPYFFLDASHTDNPYVTEEQRKNWENLDEKVNRKFVGGSWDFEKAENVWAYAFEEKVTGADVQYLPGEYLYLSFDFNVEPITCLVAQHDPYGQWIHVIKEYRLLKSDIWELTDRIIADYPEAFFVVTGDASGQARSALLKGNNKNYYTIIRQQLQISTVQQKTPKANPAIRNTRVLTNSLFSKHPGFKINLKACPHLVIDLNQVETDDGGDIDKAKDKRQTHLLDCLRYYLWTFHRNFIDKRLYEYVAND